MSETPSAGAPGAGPHAPNAVSQEVRRAAADAAAHGLAVSFVPRAGEGRPASPEIDGAVIVKTVVVQRGDGFLFVLAPLAAQFSWRRLRAHLGVNRLSLPDAEAAFAATGYRRGTISPLGASTAWPVLLDQSLAGRTLLIGSGSPGIGARVRADELVRSYAAEYVDLADPPAHTGSTSAAREERA